MTTTRQPKYRMTQEAALLDARRRANETGKPHYVKSEICGGTERFYVSAEPWWWGHYGADAIRVEPEVVQ